MKVETTCLARKILEQICADERLACLDYDVHYHHGWVEIESIEGFPISCDGMHIEVKVRAGCVERSLFTLEPSDKMWQSYGCSLEDDELSRAVLETYEKIYVRLTEIAPNIPDDVKREEIKMEESGLLVQYKILESKDEFSDSLNPLCCKDDFMWSKYTSVVGRGVCIANEDIISKIILHHLDTMGSYVMPGQVIVYRAEEKSVVEAVLMKIRVGANLHNRGGYVDKSMYQEIPTYGCNFAMRIR